MKVIHQWLCITSLLVIAIRGSLAALSVKDNTGSVLIANKNNQGNIKIKEDIDGLTDIKIHLTKPYLGHGSQKCHTPSHLTKPATAASKKVRCMGPSKGHNHSGAKSAKIVKPTPAVIERCFDINHKCRIPKPIPVRKSKCSDPIKCKTNRNVLVNPTTPGYKKNNPISIKDNSGTILVAAKNNQGNTKIRHDIGHFDDFN